MPFSSTVPAPLVATVCDMLGDRQISLIGACLFGASCLISTLASSISFLCVSMGFLSGKHSLFCKKSATDSSRLLDSY